MSQPRRFKTADARSREGQLMAAGTDELPDTAAVHRAARHLGVSAAAIASAAVATTIAPGAAAATTAVSASGIGTAGTAVGKAAGSLVTLSAVKAAATGVGIGLAVFAGGQWVRSRAPEKPATLPSLVTTQVPNPPQLSRVRPSFAPATSAIEEPEPATIAARSVSTSPSRTAEANVVEEPLAPSLGPLPSASSVGRFDDLESPAAAPNRSPTSKALLPNQNLASSSTTAPRNGTTAVDPRLAREVASLDHARATAHRGDAAAALRELDGFEHNYGYVALRKEAMLVRIDVLLSLARRTEAAATARQLLLSGAPANQRARLEDLVRGQP